MRTWFKAWAASVLPVLAVIAFLAVRNPGFFFIDDKQAQYSPVFHYIGTQLLAGKWPVLVPGQGSAANLLLDAQYGLVNPIYWLQDVIYAQFDNLDAATTLLAAVYLLILCGGVVAWALRLSSGPAWAAVAGAAAGLSGFTWYFLAASWHPGLGSLAWLPWLGWAMARRRPQVPAIVFFAFATFAGGWPFTSLAGVVVVLAALIEAGVCDGARPVVTKAMAAGAGVLLGAPSLIFLAYAFDWSTRGDAIINMNFLVPNVADALNTSMAAAASNMNNWNSPVMRAPVMFAGGLGISLACLVDWGRLRVRTPGAITLGVSAPAILLATQMPSEVGPLRYPFRMLGPWQVVVVLALCAAAGALGVVTSRRRWLACGLLLFLGFAIGVARWPRLTPVMVVSLILAALLLWLLATSRFPASLACIAVIGLWTAVVRPVHPVLSDWGVPDRVAQYQPFGDGDQLVLYPQGDYGSYAKQGVYLGQDYLYTDVRSGLGYVAIGQKYVDGAMCISLWGYTCPGVTGFLTSVEPSTGKQWLDLLGPQSVVVHDSFDLDLPEPWRPGARTADFRMYTRSRTLPGRVTYADGPIEAVSVEPAVQHYRLAAGGQRRVVVSDVYWPGYRATWNGEPLAVIPLENRLVAVDVPPGAGDLVIRYVPAGMSTAIASWVSGLLLALGAWLLSRSRARPSRGTGPSDQPATSSPL